MANELQQTELTRPYLVVPKLIEQPTWGGDYIVKAKNWQNRPELAGKKIGQAYELFSGSNLSLCTSSDDEDFVGELTDRDAVQHPTTIPNTVPLQHLIDISADGTLGAAITAQRSKIDLLLKFTQALGNSFQVHLREGHTDPHWKPKLETWYYFEPGLLTLGVKKDASWDDYQAAVSAVAAGMQEISQQVRSGQLSYEDAKPKIHALVQQYDPWQFVNMLEVGKDEVVDLSSGGVHHSWEEDTQRLPLGNVLYEVQNEAMDDISTLRSFDRGKMGADGSLRNIHIDDYFRLIDRSPETNDPQTHMRHHKSLETGEAYERVRLLKTNYYGLDKLILTTKDATYVEEIAQFTHLFVRSGRVTVATEMGKVTVGAGHSCFVPAAAAKYEVRCESPDAEVLITT